MTEISPDAPLDEPQDGQADEGPVPVAAPGPVPHDRIAELEAELARLRSAAVTEAHVLLRVLPPHSQFTHAGRTVGADFVPVPSRAAAEMQAAAGYAGVTLDQEEG